MRSLRSKASYGKTAMTLTFLGFKIPLLHALLTTGLGQECREGAFPWSCPVASHVSSKAVARSLHRVAGQPRGCPALSELGVTVSRHPAQALRTPLLRRRGFETERRWR